MLTPRARRGVWSIVGLSRGKSTSRSAVRGAPFGAAVHLAAVAGPLVLPPAASRPTDGARATRPTYGRIECPTNVNNDSTTNSTRLTTMKTLNERPFM